jgi:uncharacterized protein YndB with AHSA1/START domain
MSEAHPDRIEKKILLRAPRSRVWRALTDSSEFGDWFGVKFDSPFAPGRALRGVMVGTKADPVVAAAQQPYVGEPFEITIERMEPEQLFSFRWHPFAKRGFDYSNEPTTLIEFSLEEVSGGVMLTVTESGFDRIPLARRVEAFTANEQGWSMMVGVIEKYVGAAPESAGRHDLQDVGRQTR